MEIWKVIPEDIFTQLKLTEQLSVSAEGMIEAIRDLYKAKRLSEKF